jgi:hypothetical protein
MVGHTLVTAAAICAGLGTASVHAAPGTLSTAGTGIPRTEDGDGIKVGPRSLLHPGFALLIGGDSKRVLEPQARRRRTTPLRARPAGPLARRR